MSEYKKFSRYLVRSVDHIFRNFLEDDNVVEVYESQSAEKDPRVAVEIKGGLEGELLINFPVKTLDLLTKKFLNTKSSRSVKKSYPDVAGELANLITGTFANQLQFMNYDIRLSPPEYEEDPIQIKALYDNVNLSFLTQYGGFDVDFYYRSPDKD